MFDKAHIFPELLLLPAAASHRVWPHATVAKVCPLVLAPVPLVVPFLVRQAYARSDAAAAGPCPLAAQARDGGGVRACQNYRCARVEPRRPWLAHCCGGSASGCGGRRGEPARMCQGEAEGETGDRERERVRERERRGGEAEGKGGIQLFPPAELEGDGRSGWPGGRSGWLRRRETVWRCV